MFIYRSKGVDFYLAKQIDTLSDDIDDDWLHKVIEFCDTQTGTGTAIMREGVEHAVGGVGEEGFNESAQTKVETSVTEGVETGFGGVHNEKMVVEGHNIIIYAGSDTSESSEDDIYNAVDGSEDASDEDDLQAFNTKFSVDDNRPTFTIGMKFANAVEVRAAIAKMVPQGVFR